MSDLRKLAQFIHDITWDQLPERVRETAALRVLDLVSVAAGAAKDPLVAAAKQARNKTEEFLSVVCPGREQETIEKILNLAGEEKLPVI